MYIKETLVVLMPFSHRNYIYALETFGLRGQVSQDCRCLSIMQMMQIFDELISIHEEIKDCSNFFLNVERRGNEKTGRNFYSKFFVKKRIVSKFSLQV